MSQLKGKACRWVSYGIVSFGLYDHALTAKNHIWLRSDTFLLQYALTSNSAHSFTPFISQCNPQNGLIADLSKVRA